MKRNIINLSTSLERCGITDEKVVNFFQNYNFNHPNAFRILIDIVRICDREIPDSSTMVYNMLTLFTEKLYKAGFNPESVEKIIKELTEASKSFKYMYLNVILGTDFTKLLLNDLKSNPKIDFSN